MRKIMVLILVLVCVVSLVACKNDLPDASQLVANGAANTDATTGDENTTEPTGVEMDVMDSGANIGVTFAAKDITPTGMTLIVKQSGGEPTGELKTGSFYVIDKFDGSDWVGVPYVSDESSNAWDSDVYWLEMDGEIEIVMDWSEIYGELPAGKYRLSKDIVDFRGLGDFDPSMHHFEFEIA